MSFLEVKPNQKHLSQGELLNKHSNYINDKCDYSLISKSTMEYMDSINDSSSKLDSTKSHTITSSEVNQGEFKELESLDTSFNKVLAEYTLTLKLMNEEIVKKSANYSTIKDLFGKVVINNDSDKVFVNNYGVTHKYSKQSWDNNSSTCPQTPMGSTGSYDLSTLPQGSNMGIGQACYIAGKNIQNKQTKEVAWVDIQGLKHIYGNTSWKNKSKTCDIDPIKVSDNAYNSIPSGSNMTDKDLCMTLDVDPKIFSKLNTLNGELMDIANEINNKMKKLNITDKKISSQMTEQQGKFVSYINELSSDRDQIHTFSNNYQNVAGLQDDTRLMYNTYYYNYLAWTLAALTIGGITIHQITRK